VDTGTGSLSRLILRESVSASWYACYSIRTTSLLIYASD